MSERVLVEPEDLTRADGVAEVAGDRAHHLLRVVRAATGDAVELFDGRGHTRDAVITRCERDRVTLRFTGDVREGTREDGARVTWLQGVPKGDKLDGIVRQATELGVWRVWPVYTARSVPRDHGGAAARRGERLRRIAEEASRQCGRADVPEVRDPAPLDEALLALAHTPDALRIVPWERATQRLTELLAATGAPVGEAVALSGPEGGITDDEITRARRAGFCEVSLGPRILRAETVAPALLAILSAWRGDLRFPPLTR